MRDQITEMYVERGMSQGDVALAIGCSQAIICRVLKRWGIKARPKSNSGSKNGRYIDGKQSRVYRTVVKKELCNRCGSTSNLCVHHVNDDHYDNEPSNLEVLCVSCHMSHHKTQYWDAWRKKQTTPKSNGPVGWARRG